MERRPITLYAFVISPFVQKVAALLDYKRLPFRPVFVHPQRKAEIQFSTKKLVPIIDDGGTIVEDSTAIALDLEEVVTSIGHTVKKVARTKREAVAAFKAVRPGLVLADIQLADGSSGLDAVNEILGETDVPVIFITAYPEQVLTGLRPEPTFLIPKPFRHETVKAVISQALFFDMKAKGKRAIAP